MPKIMVHEKALAHLSRGLYRSPASALRELISNAWDASARVVRINTNYPNFMQLSVEDNGDGFSKDDFEDLMSGGIGNSDKQKRSGGLINGRPVIGRLGIGMLGIAQICGTFTVISKPKKGEGFRATVRLYDLLREKLDTEADEVVVSAYEVDVGTYDFQDFDPARYKYGTQIISDDVHPTFVRSFQKSLQFEVFREPPAEWAKAIKVVSSVRSLQELGDYWRLLWELAACCPISYIGPSALPAGMVSEDHDRLEAFDFRVIVDGIELRKPVHLRGNKNGYTTYKIEPQETRVYGKPLRFHGYVVVQEGLQLNPDELRGLLIRIKDVGIGYYDTSMLDYRFNEGPRSRWVTGEIFVDEGLEAALNVDRDSFNRFHPEYRCVQEFLHRILKEKIFSESYRKIDARSQARNKESDARRTEHLRVVVAEETCCKTVVKHAPPRAEDSDELPRAEVEEKDGKVSLSIPAPSEIRIKKSNRHLASAMLGIFELALKSRDRDKQREIFTKLLMDLLAKW